MVLHLRMDEMTYEYGAWLYVMGMRETLEILVPSLEDRVEIYILTRLKTNFKKPVLDEFDEVLLSDR